jgi:hypothetical protein
MRALVEVLIRELLCLYHEDALIKVKCLLWNVPEASL